MTTTTERPIENPPPKPLATVTIHTDSGDVSMPCEPAASWSPEVREAVGMAWLVEFCCDAEYCDESDAEAAEQPEGVSA